MNQHYFGMQNLAKLATANIYTIQLVNFPARIIF